MSAHPTNRDGFSLVEVIVAIVILTAGLLAMASTTGLVALQVRDAGARTERGMAVQATVEKLRAVPFDSIKSRSSTAADTVSGYAVWWSVSNDGVNIKTVTITSDGRGYITGTGWTAHAQETFQFRVARP